MAVAIASPHEELVELEQQLGQRPLARVLGKSQRLVWSWIHEGRKFHPKSARLISDAAGVVRVLTATREFRPGELEYLLETPWPALGAAPSELIQNGKAELVVAALEHEATVDVSVLSEAKEESMSKTTRSGVAARLTQAAAERPAQLSSQLTRFKPYDADEQFAQGRIGNVREMQQRPAASGHVRGLTSDEPLNW